MHFDYLPVTFIFLNFVIFNSSSYQHELKKETKKEYSQSRSFKINYTNHIFMKDDKPFQYISGSLLYTRIPESYWYDRLSKMKSAGLNTIQFYVPWNFHEYEEGKYNFVGNADLDRFLRLARYLDLLVLLRSGPYICGEWDFGGLPAWLLRKNPNMILRSSNPDYLQAVLKWYSVLLPILKPHLYQNNGSIIMIQIENEYGSYYTCDNEYLKALYDSVRFYLGNEIIIYSTDGNSYSYLKCGSSDRRIFSTVDFGTLVAYNPDSAFHDLIQWQPRSPLVNSEYYSGWLDSWGMKHNTVPTSNIVNGLSKLYNYSKRVNVNMYMFHGGTTFGFWNGANYPVYLPQVSSYDYDAPLSEAGDITDKYMKIRNYLATLNPDKPFPPIPPNTTKIAYGLLVMKQKMDFLTKLLTESSFISTYPVTMEAIGHYQGYMVYLTSISEHHYESGKKDSATIRFSRIGDFAYIFTSNLDNTEINYQGKLDRNARDLSMTIAVNSNLIILVENSGHINFGHGMLNDVKGIIGNVTLNGNILTNWQHFPINLNDVQSIMNRITKLSASVPSQSGLFTSTFFINTSPQDTFLKTSNFSKGVALINNFNLGRYWNTKGPQYTLFIPKSVLIMGWNNVTLFELEGSKCSLNCYVEFVDKPIVDGPIHFFK